MNSSNTDLSLWQTFMLHSVFAILMFLGLEHLLHQHHVLKEHAFSKLTFLQSTLTATYKATAVRATLARSL